MSERGDSDSDAPEEFTSQQGKQLDEEIRRVQKDSKARVVREGKERRRLWAQRKTPKPSKVNESVQDQDVEESEIDKESQINRGMLPDDVVQLLAAREKKVYFSDSEDEKAELKPLKRKKKLNSAGVETVILKDEKPSQCLQNSLEFLKRKKMQVPRSSSVLDNSNQALRLISTTGFLMK